MVLAIKKNGSGSNFLIYITRIATDGSNMDVNQITI